MLAAVERLPNTSTDTPGPEMGGIGWVKSNGSRPATDIRRSKGRPLPMFQSTSEKKSRWIHFCTDRNSSDSALDKGLARPSQLLHRVSQSITRDLAPLIPFLPETKFRPLAG